MNFVKWFKTKIKNRRQTTLHNDNNGNEDEEFDLPGPNLRIDDTIKLIYFASNSPNQDVIDLLNSFGQVPILVN